MRDVTFLKPPESCVAIAKRCVSESNHDWVYVTAARLELELGKRPACVFGLAIGRLSSCDHRRRQRADRCPSARRGKSSFRLARPQQGQRESKVHHRVMGIVG